MISAILLAAGQSKRLIKENKLTKIYKSKQLINHSLNSLIKSKIVKIFIVLGYEKNKLKLSLYFFLQCYLLLMMCHQQ